MNKERFTSELSAKITTFLDYKNKLISLYRRLYSTKTGKSILRLKRDIS